MKAKDINVFKLFSKTFKDRKMYGFMGFGEISRMPKVDKPIRQTKPRLVLACNLVKYLKEKQYCCKVFPIKLGLRILGVLTCLNTIMLLIMTILKNNKEVEDAEACLTF